MALVAEEAVVVAGTDPNTVDVHAVYDSFDAPEGFRVELIDGRIIMSPPPVSGHSGMLHRLYEHFLRDNRPDGTVVNFSPIAIALPNTPNKDHYIPDLCVVDEEVADDFDNWKQSADVFHLVVEVVSVGRDSQRDDRETKPLGYASGPVPLYLLLDPLRREATLFSEPSDGRYLARSTVAFGGKIPFPEPFGGVLDTSIFVH